MVQSHLLKDSIVDGYYGYSTVLLASASHFSSQGAAFGPSAVGTSAGDVQNPQGWTCTNPQPDVDASVRGSENLLFYSQYTKWAMVAKQLLVDDCRV